MSYKAIITSELIELVAQREGIVLAEGEACGDDLARRWADQLTERQVAMLDAFDAMVDRYRDQALADHRRRATTEPDGNLH